MNQKFKTHIQLIIKELNYPFIDVNVQTPKNMEHGDLTTNTSEKLKSSGGPITQDNTGVEYYCTIFAANESPINEGLIWVGSDDGLLHLTRNGGKTWENITPKNLTWPTVLIQPQNQTDGEKKNLKAGESKERILITFHFKILM